MNNKLTHEELKNAAQSLVDILNKYGCPHSMIIVQQDSVELLSGEMAVPFEVKD